MVLILSSLHNNLVGPLGQAVVPTDKLTLLSDLGTHGAKDPDSKDKDTETCLRAYWKFVAGPGLVSQSL